MSIILTKEFTSDKSYQGYNILIPIFIGKIVTLGNIRLFAEISKTNIKVLSSGSTI